MKSYSAVCGFRGAGHVYAGMLPTAVTTTLDDGSVSKTTTQYDHGSGFTLSSGSGTFYLGTVTQTQQYDYGPNLVRTIATEYKDFVNSSYRTANILDLPVSKITTNAAGTKVAETDYDYDLFSLNSSGVAQNHGSAPNGSVRGNLSKVTQWLNGGTSPVSEYTYNDTGTKYQYFDPKAVAAGGPGSAAATDTYQYSGTYYGAYQTSTTDVLGHVVSATYNFNSGTVASFTDQNSKATTFQYDLRNRPTQAKYPLESQTNLQGETDVTYIESAFPFSMNVSQLIDAGRSKTSTTLFDGLGRSTQSQQTSDPQGTVYLDTVYDAHGRVYSVSNPYRSGDTKYYTTTFFDGMGRKKDEYPQDSTVGGSANEVHTAYSGASTTVTDQTGRTHKTVTNALGWLTTVFENPGGFAGAATYETDYSYDALGNLYCVQQKGNAGSGTLCPTSPSSTNPFSSLASNNYRGRWFVYDSLSRLTDAYNPETQHTNWAYDVNSNVTSKTDAKGQTITYSYDSENRVTGKTYSAGDHSVAYEYDGTNPFSGYTVTNGIHHRTGMVDASGMSAWSFDERGRKISEKRTIGTVTKSASTTYNVMGLPTTLTYANGTVITYNYDTEGRTASVVDSAHSVNYVSGPQTACAAAIAGLSPACYAASGAIATYLNGYDPANPTYGVTVTDQYNSRLQPGTITASAASGTILSYTYNFQLGTADNGDLWGLTNNLDNTHSKNFSYDAYNRISEYKTPNSSLWDVKYTIDPWGNLTTKAVQSGYGGEGLATGAATNANQLPGYEYDGGTPTNGNVTYDGTNRYTYDSENRISSVTTAGVNYLYDGDGERVQKSNGKSYWGGSNGEPQLETDNSGNALNEYVYFNGMRIARRAISGGAVHYTFSDHLKSATVIADNQGNVQKQYDYAPYGELHWQSGTDPNHYQFAGKELDTESGDSYFGARYYRSNFGRFITPDWSATPAAIPYARIWIPQTLNLYAYVTNNPVTGIDPDGHLGDPDRTTVQARAGDEDYLRVVTTADNSLMTVDNLGPKAESSQEQKSYKNKDKAAAAAGSEIRKSKNGYRWEYGARIHKEGKRYTYGPVVTQQNEKGVDLPTPQKNDVGDIHNHNYGVGDDAHANSIELPDKISTIKDKEAVQKMNGGANVDYSSYVLAPNGNLIKFTPNPNAADNLGDTKVVERNIAPDPNAP